MNKYILGISCFYHDSAATLINNGEIVAAVQEERFSRLKHDSRFPFNAIRYCLESQKIDLRDAFFERFLDHARVNKDFVILTADMDSFILRELASEFPQKCLDIGISEQNMTSMACGLSIEGHKVYTYSIGNFPTLRCFEQIRNDICYHNVDTTIVSVGAGFSYGQLGISHFATEDISVSNAIKAFESKGFEAPTVEKIETVQIPQRYTAAEMA